jgi:hypothetical protein
MIFEKLLRHRSDSRLKCECGSVFFKIVLRDYDIPSIVCSQCDEQVALRDIDKVEGYTNG